ncbi:MAG: hypothetical protein IT435_15940 [Phycisphaerales bacterium]|nr:hypothetical protein [Phycisphaerales bacterium]
MTGALPSIHGKQLRLNRAYVDAAKRLYREELQKACVSGDSSRYHEFRAGGMRSTLRMLDLMTAEEAEADVAELRRRRNQP